MNQNEDQGVEQEEVQMIGKYEYTDISQVSMAHNIGKFIAFSGEIAMLDEIPYIGDGGVHMTCTPTDSRTCQSCPNYLENAFSKKFDASSDFFLNFIKTKKSQINAIRRSVARVPQRCPGNAMFESGKSVNLTCAMVTPSTEYIGKLDKESYQKMYQISIPIVIIDNNKSIEEGVTCSFRGCTHRDPNTGKVMFLAEKVVSMGDSISSFKMTDEVHQRLKKFQPEKNGVASMQEKFDDLNHELKVNHYKIHGRKDVALATLLTMTSPIGFTFGDYDEGGKERGWVETAIMGDTRTGKSQVVDGIRDCCDLGYKVDGAFCSHPGLVGAVSQNPFTKQPCMNWGVFPRNDGKMVFIDEAHNPVSMAAMPMLNEVRSSGIANVNKSSGGKTIARVRKIIGSNPPYEKSMDDYAFNVGVLKDVMGAPEAISRFDLFICTRARDITDKQRKAPFTPVPDHYGPDLGLLIRFAWSRRPDQVIVSDDVVDFINEESGKLSRQYDCREIPLFTIGDTTMKLARLSCAMAILNYASKDDNQGVIHVSRSHVKMVIEFIHGRESGDKFIPGLYTDEKTGYHDYVKFMGRYKKFKNFGEFHNVASCVRAEFKDHPELLEEISGEPIINSRYIKDVWDIDDKKIRRMTTALVRHKLAQKSRNDLRRTKRGTDVIKFLLSLPDLQRPIERKHVEPFFKRYLI